jgi:hypothetical protein
MADLTWKQAGSKMADLTWKQRAVMGDFFGEGVALVTSGGF